MLGSLSGGVIYWQVWPLLRNSGPVHILGTAEIEAKDRTECLERSVIRSVGTKCRNEVSPGSRRDARNAPGQIHRIDQAIRSTSSTERKEHRWQGC